MSEMINRIAWAMRENSEMTVEMCIPLARAAIEAMREPTDEMLFVGSNDEAGFTAGNLRESWYLMINEALK